LSPPYPGVTSDGGFTPSKRRYMRVRLRIHAIGRTMLWWEGGPHCLFHSQALPANQQWPILRYYTTSELCCGCFAKGLLAAAPRAAYHTPACDFRGWYIRRGMETVSYPTPILAFQHQQQHQHEDYYCLCHSQHHRQCRCAFNNGPQQLPVHRLVSSSHPHLLFR